MKVVAPTIITLAALVLVATAPSATTARTTRVSVSTSQPQGDRPSCTAGISASGRFVAFTSQATDFVPGDTNDRQDAFVFDRQTGRTGRVSVTSSGAQAKPGPIRPAARPRSRSAPTAATSCSDPTPRTSSPARPTTRPTPSSATAQPADPAHSVARPGRQGRRPQRERPLCRPGRGRERLPLRPTQPAPAPPDGEGERLERTASISARGRYVAFTSHASNLVRGDTNNLSDVFVRDRKGKTTRSASRAGPARRGRDVERQQRPAITATAATSSSTRRCRTSSPATRTASSTSSCTTSAGRPSG